MVFDRFFKSKEVKQTLHEIDGFLAAHDGLCKYTIQRAATALARDKSRTIHSIRVDGLKADQLALILISNVLARELPSGTHHIYRGALNMIGADMLSLWSKVISALLDRGYYTSEQASEDMRWINEEVQKVG